METETICHAGPNTCGTGSQPASGTAASPAASNSTNPAPNSSQTRQRKNPEPPPSDRVLQSTKPDQHGPKPNPGPRLPQPRLHQIPSNLQRKTHSPRHRRHRQTQRPPLSNKCGLRLVSPWETVARGGAKPEDSTNLTNIYSINSHLACKNSSNLEDKCSFF